jgi:hypothetical protein
MEVCVRQLGAKRRTNHHEVCHLSLLGIDGCTFHCHDVLEDRHRQG